MELSNMFTEQKWNILKCLSEGGLSPLQLSEKLDSTMANISHQLKLLEAANLVQKTKIKNRDKGKPRSVFSLTNDYVYLVPTMDNFAGKKLLKVTDHHKIMLRIWFLQNTSLHYPLEKLYWKIEKNFDDVQGIYVDELSNKITIVSKNKDLKKMYESINADITLIDPKKLSEEITNSNSSVTIYERSSSQAA